MLELSEVDLKVVRGINNAVKSRGEGWRYPNGWVDEQRIEDFDIDPDWALFGGGCYNLLPNGDPACIIGFVAVDQGLPTERESSAEVDARNWQVSNAVSAAIVLAQNEQDSGYVWGKARDAFYDELVEYGASPEQVSKWKEL